MKAAQRYTTDHIGNARRLVDTYGDQIRYVPEARSWFLWDGKRWAEDKVGGVTEMAKTLPKAILKEANQFLGSDGKAFDAVVQWARASGMASTITFALQLARSDPRVVMPLEETDADPWVLNVENGTLNLLTSELRAHRQEDKLTKLAAVTWDPSAQSPLWERVLEDATGGDDELTDFLQRLAGYTLAGVPREEVFPYVHGPGGSGKSTVTEPLAKVLGDYAITAKVETFCARTRSGNNASNDVARLAGARMVITSEPDQGERLAAGFIKGLTGGDTVTARHLFKEEFEFRPQLTLWFVANDRLYVPAGDSGIFRRLLEVPFGHVIPEEERDPEVKETLLNDPEAQSAILAWAVAGFHAWRRSGLQPPLVVRAATEEYQRRMSPLADFIDEALSFDPEAWTSSGDLYGHYLAWYRGPNQKQLHKRTFGKELASIRGLVPGQEATGARRRGWAGVALLPLDGELDTVSSMGVALGHGMETSTAVPR